MFCNHSHQVMFHKKKITEVEEQLHKITEKVNNKNLVEIIVGNPQMVDSKKEGYHYVSYLGKWIKDD